MQAMAESGRFRLEFAYRRLRASFVARVLSLAPLRYVGTIALAGYDGFF